MDGKVWVSRILDRPWCRLLGLFWLSSGLLKLTSLGHFQMVIVEYEIVPLSGVILLARSVVICELLLGGLLLLQLWMRPALIASIFVLVIFSASLLVGLWRGNSLADCGCLGAWVSISSEWAMVRNILLLGVSGWIWWRLPESSSRHVSP